MTEFVGLDVSKDTRRSVSGMTEVVFLLRCNDRHPEWVEMPAPHGDSVARRIMARD